MGAMNRPYYPDNDAYIDNDEFFTELDNFKVYFYDELERNIPEEDTYAAWEQAWMSVRDVLLPRYPLLERCYLSHGRHHDEEYQNQPYAAKLGRKVAGVMGYLKDQLRKDLARQGYQYDDEEFEVPEQARYSGIAGRGKRSDIMRTKAFGSKKEPAKEPTQTDLIAMALKDLRADEYVKLVYDDMKTLRRDQSLLRNAAETLGWLDGYPHDYIAWESWTEIANPRPNETIYLLVVARLDEPRPYGG
jgi:hypothetical protein